MDCPECNEEMVVAQATNFGTSYYYCRNCKKELGEMENTKPISYEDYLSDASRYIEGYSLPHLAPSVKSAACTHAYVITSQTIHHSYTTKYKTCTGCGDQTTEWEIHQHACPHHSVSYAVLGGKYVGTCKTCGKDM